MMLLADRLGYVQLAEPVRFTAGWEREASLRLRRGDATALDDYDQHGRIRGAPPEQAMDQAVHAYVASYLAGRDVLLMAADWARCRELAARIRDDLIHLGLVEATRAVRIAEGAEASAGDLIICRHNDHRLEAGEPGRALANGDILRIEAITGGGLMVRRLLEADPATGRRRFTDRAFCYAGYQSCDLAYAITGHSAQGATVHTGIALVTGTEDRQWLYPAMTRGTDANLAFVFTTPPKAAAPQPGTRAAPELDRYERIRRERRGFLPTQPAAGPGNPDPREPIAVLADVLDRDGAELSASETRRRNLANADHLGILNTIWAAETRGAREDRYRELVMAALPAGHRQPLSHQARWLFRTLHAAELAGLDPAEVTRTTIASRDLAGARDIASVLDTRIRQRVDPLLPQPQSPWAERVPQLPDAERRAYLAEIASMMDGRKQRLGQHAAEIAPVWAVTALGPVPDDAAVRQEWERKAASIAAYREMFGYDHPDDPIGPEPTRDTPDQRTAWQEAFLALGPAGQPDVRAMRDGRLWLIRDTYAAETAWAPRHVGRELRLARLGAANADLGATRAAAEADAARKAGDHARAGRHEELAASYRAMADRYRQQESSSPPRRVLTFPRGTCRRDVPSTTTTQTPRFAGRDTCAWPGAHRCATRWECAAAWRFCYLLDPGNELIHVKRARGSAPLSHLFSQGLVSVQSLVTGPRSPPCPAGAHSRPTSSRGRSSTPSCWKTAGGSPPTRCSRSPRPPLPTPPGFSAPMTSTSRSRPSRPHDHAGRHAQQGSGISVQAQATPWPITIPGTWVTAASRCTFLFPPALAPLRSFPSTATPWRAGTCPGSPQAAGSSHGCCGCGRNQPSSRSSRNFSAAGGFGFLFFRRSSSPRCCSARCAAYAAGTAGSSAAAATAADSAASSSSASSSLASLPSIDADGDARSPVRGQVQQPCAASTSWSQPAAACATASGPLSAAAAPAAITDTSDGSGCRFPRALRESVSRPSSDSRRDTGSSTAPAGRWRRMQSVSHDEDAGAVKAVLR